MTSNNLELDFKPESHPWSTFKLWFEAAHKTNLTDPNAMVLSTYSADKEVSSRVLLCKELTPDGLIFFTNYDSEKGNDLASHSQCAINFFWEPLYRQVRLQGHCSKTDRTTSINYWKTRPRERQLSQWASQQSRPLATRELMQTEISKAEQKFLNQEIPCPENWGGYLFIPHRVEFWVGHHGRFHDRYNYTKVQNSWHLQRLYP